MQWKGYKALQIAVNKILEELPGSSVRLPLFVYYPINRSVLDIPLRIKVKHQFDVQLVALSDNTSANFRTFFEWFREREDYENERRLPPIGDDDRNPTFSIVDFRDPQLESVRNAIYKFTQFKYLRIQRKPRLQMIVKKRNKLLIVNQLSDGEKCLLAMVGDLARRLAIANPSLDDPLQGEGVVLIDEIELHLHPAWQRKVITQFSETFPNCQFIVSTHSPQVISHVKPESVFLLSLESGEIVLSKPKETYGKNSDRILEDLMDVPSRPSEVERDLHELFEAIDAIQIDKARKKLKKLREKIGDDSELIRAEFLLHRKETLGK